VGKQYYYLISGLRDLINDPGNRTVIIDEFIRFCEEELDSKDFIVLKKLFLFNDIKNIIARNSGIKDFVYPSYYSIEEFNENEKDTDSFLPFIAEYFNNKRSDKRIYPDLNETDELIHLFYDHLNSDDSDFVKKYFEFELNLRNISNAISMRINGKIDREKLIYHGDYIENIIKSNTLDMGLADEFTFIPKLIEAYNTADLIKIEKTIDEIRWNWIEQETDLDFFGAPVVFGYMIKLISVERWLSIDTPKGKAVLDELINRIRESVKFSNEYINGGGSNNG